MNGIVVTILCLVVHMLPLTMAKPFAVADRSGLCKNDTCVNEADHGMSLLQLKVQPTSNHTEQHKRPANPCTWWKSDDPAGTEFLPEPHNYKALAESIQVEDCHLLALVDADCYCPASVVFNSVGRKCSCSKTADPRKVQTDDPNSQIWLSSCPGGECDIFGDPHIRVFDQGAETVNLLSVSESSWRQVEPGEAGELGEDSFEIGDYWLVKSDLVKIQGRYTRVQRRDSNNPFMTAVAIGDSILGHNILIVEPANGTVTWNGKEILTTLPSEFVVAGLIEAKYHNESTIIGDDVDSDQKTRGIDIHLPKRGVRLVVNRFPRFLCLSVNMSRHAGGKGGVDGQCGNFNGQEDDDTASFIEERNGGQISPSESFFAEMLYRPR